MNSPGSDNKLLRWPLKSTQKYTNIGKCTKYKTHHKSTLETLKKSGKVDLVDWAFETGEGTKNQQSLGGSSTHLRYVH